MRKKEYGFWKNCMNPWTNQNSSGLLVIAVKFKCDEQNN